ncbi:hypothetical protein CHS0354_038741 [Potamilus streckersoni]|uniref:Leucine-rich repeat-containing protein 46 n=1 Tax=Potamilus streckersoni TaxID=2493646 RepID=A0AAE0VZW8_9BIVA|nr:hypothetical protein CHS0354_038741 [Potamilus streckersoni]
MYQRGNEMIESENLSTNYEEEKKDVRLSLHLIVKRHLSPEAEQWDQEKILEALNEITRLRLDRESISEIDGLELLGDNVNYVYLQQNHIEVIKNLECLRNLQFLTLSGNRIKVIENLTHLSKLLFLDLSENQIEKVDVDEIPQSVIILNLKENPCTKLPDYRGRIIQDLPRLKQLDEVEITKSEKKEAGHEVSSDSEEDEDETGEEKDNADIKGNFQDIMAKMLLRSQKRLEDSLKEHKRHLAELDDIRLSTDLPPSSRSKSSRDTPNSIK